MNLESLLRGDGVELKRVATTHGGEYAGPCPWCGGRDRFRVWPEEGRYWCRGCGKAGDDVQYLREYRGLSFPDAWKLAGRGPLPASPEYKTSQGGLGAGPKTSQGGPGKVDWKPESLSLPGEQWQGMAEKLVDFAASRLTMGDREFFGMRGLTPATINEARLGYWPKNCYRDRSAWGLPEKIVDGHKRDLWIPAGLVIPHFIKDQVVRVRVRRYEGEPRYYILPGSSMVPMVLGGEGSVIAVVESELDGLLLWQDCGDLAGIIALGSAQARPDRTAADILQKAKLILIALDYDEAGGQSSWKWWLKVYAQASRWPPIRGKDVGAMYQAGVDVRKWLEGGIEKKFPIKRKVIEG
ncbi:MAG: zinc-binding protein [Deltaproteobacteria bacterium]|nr:zinc-binding protein [Deltaproteobacteria bacterium]